MPELKIEVIPEGTVIDHIPAGRWLKVVEILGLTKPNDGTLLIASNVPSKKLGRKDIVKIEGRYLNEEEVNKIALIAPMATVNIVKDYKISGKFNVEIPDEIVGILRCPNPNCISNHEYVAPKFRIESREPLKLRCRYCERTIEGDEILGNL
ncbi:aspartate carbamoyltransferase regulatory subunit [Thermococcus sp.]|uniref:aspartate carbamoyltransferase regulatory subunit n=1 Tax=Thermococcus sp. TaxID=35749 RepID=UPI00261554C6|nr:aspartate carbamoyltransferase regulatory subunit [Thermococcus sp.]